jgi:hypothetical protein
MMISTPNFHEETIPHPTPHPLVGVVWKWKYRTFTHLSTLTVWKCGNASWLDHLS